MNNTTYNTNINQNNILNINNNTLDNQPNNNKKNENEKEYPPLRILTQNIQGLSNRTKQEQLLNTLTLQKIDIMGLSETKLTQQVSKLIYKKNNTHVAFFDNSTSTGSHMGSGVGLLIAKEYAQYISKIERFKGRIIYVDLYLKGRTKLRIIQIYLHANVTGNQKEIKELYNYIENVLDDAEKHNFMIILMGDFNLDYEQYSKEYRRRGAVNWRYKIFNSLDQRQLVDTIDICQDITPSTPFHTFIPKQQQSSPTRIDYIWVSHALLSEVINSNNYEPHLYNTDHKAVYLSLYTDTIFKKKSIAKLKQQNVRKRIFSYDKMNAQKWLKYKEATDANYEEANLNNMNINNIHELNRYWDIIQSCIKTAAIAEIDNHMTSTQHKEQEPKYLKNIFENIRRLNKILISHSYKNWDRYSFDLEVEWRQRTKHQIKDLIALHKYSMELPHDINNLNINNIRKEIRLFRSTLLVKAENLNNYYTKEKIKFHLKKRCDDYTSDKGHMINSSLNREKRKITIDRLLIIQDNQEILTTDQNTIKQATNNHFQQCPGGVHEEKIIPPQWQQQYAPIEEINQDIYKYLMTPPNSDEWSKIINSLPTDKAAGPSEITNEMLKHLGEKMQKCIRYFISACLKLNDIPTAWKEAYVYPIPKPKEWNCDLNNTRPITLLDTLRKALVKLLNNRLANIMVKHKILQSNQFAGLPNSSTFEPLRIINEIIQDAKEKNNELWILFQDLSKAYDRVNIHMLNKALQRLKIPNTFNTFICNIFTN
jgi:endonuclease/exonuclease/phosphatase family metal-dependent hydrolase